MRLRFASYNIHKAVGRDRKCDPERIMAVLREIDADVIVLQEADRRFGDRASVLPRALLDDYPWKAVDVARRPRSIGWHGNAILVRRECEVQDSEALHLPTLEPRGAANAVIAIEGRNTRIIGTHLDLSGLRRRDQVRALLEFVARTTEDCPTIIGGDFNQWGRFTGAMREFGDDWHAISPGPSYPSRGPIARLDRIVTSPSWLCHDAHVHHSPLASVASDHLPVYAELDLPEL